MVIIESRVKVLSPWLILLALMTTTHMMKPDVWARGNNYLKTVYQFRQIHSQGAPDTHPRSLPYTFWVLKGHGSTIATYCICVDLDAHDRCAIATKVARIEAV